MERRLHYCSQCGSPVDEQASACSTCGAALSLPSFPPGRGLLEAMPATDGASASGTAAAEGGAAQGPLMPPSWSFSTSGDAGDAVPRDGAVPPTPSGTPVAPAAPAQQPAAPVYAYPYPYPFANPNPNPYAGAAAYPPASWQPAAYPNASPPYTGVTSAPGYPTYPQGLPTFSAPNPPPGSAQNGNQPYGYSAYGAPAFSSPYTYPYAYPVYPVYWKPRRAPGETHALVVSWIVTVFGGLSILCGMIFGLVIGLLAAVPTGEGLATLAVLVELTVAPIVAGGFAVYYGIRGILRKPSPRFSIPSPLFFLALTVLVLGAGVVFWHLTPAPGSPGLILPLVFLAGILPAFTILAFTARRLGLPSTRRHVWMSLLYGLTLAPLLAIILEVIALVVVSRISGVGSASLGVPSNSASDPLLLIVLLLTVSLVAPVVEEGVKPLGAVLLMRRLRTPASAFLLGMAAGVGFDIFETIGYIGQGQADWITIAIERVGGGLLHGVGAGMATLGWYYLINGRGVSRRWLRGIGCILYAVVQHAIFNGVFVVTLIPGLGNWLSQSWYIGRLPFQNADFLDLALYVLILWLLYVVTGRLGRGARPPATVTPLPEANPPAETIDDAGSAAVGSGAR